jgi:hypothetical protein
MTYEDRFSQPLDGHELVAIARHDGVYWCLRCGALHLEKRPGVREQSVWEAPAQAGRSHASKAAPACLPSTAADAHNPAGDARLMLRALTHGWRCEPVLLSTRERTEAWRWSCDGPLGGEAWSVPGDWEDGPLVDDQVRSRLLLHVRGA